MAKVQIHVNRYLIAYNRKHRTFLPVFTIKGPGNKNTYADSVEIIGPVRMVYQPCDPLSCGAVAWVEAEDYNIFPENPCDYSKVREYMEANNDVVEEALTA